jgi:hypothetical protein
MSMKSLKHDMHADLSGKYVQFASELDKPQA